MLHEDKALLAAYRSGETWAFELLFRQYSDPVRRFLAGGFTFVSRGRTCRYRGSHAGVDADAVLQETFARAFAPSTRGHYDGERPFKNYLFSIAKNLVLRELQRKERVAAVDSTEDNTDIALRRARQDTPGGLLPDEHSPERTFADGELQEITRVFIGTLTDEQRQFFQHRFVHGLTQEATADVMAVTRARVKLLEKGMRRRFLEALRQAGYFVDYTPKPRWSRPTRAA